MFDILIRSGLVVDGSGTAGFQADVAIAGGRIAEVGLLADAGATTVIDATGLVVAPGFIDMHSHADFSLSAASPRRPSWKRPANRRSE